MVNKVKEKGFDFNLFDKIVFTCYDEKYNEILLSLKKTHSAITNINTVVRSSTDFVLFCELAPIENVHAPFSEAFRRKMHAGVLGGYVLALLFTGICRSWNIVIAKIILTAVLLSGSSIWWARVRL